MDNIDDGQFEEAEVSVNDESHKIFQLKAIAFNAACNSKSENQSDDFTGMRVYAGAHLAINALRKLQISCSIFRECRSIVELGCGCGVVGLLSFKDKAGSLLLTDGNAQTVRLAQLNANVTLTPNLKVSCKQLLWGRSENIGFLGQCRLMIENHQEKCRQISGECFKSFDVVIGCELMYFCTKFEDLVDTAMSLASGGIFFHTHIFRRDGLAKELCDYMTSCGWDTLLLPLEDVASPLDITYHPEWYKARILVSGPKDVIYKLIEEESGLRWRHYNGEENDEEDAEDEEILSLFGL